MKNYKYVFFDLDGTLTDSKEGITKSVANALEYFNITVDSLDSLCKFIGPPLRDSFKKYYGFSDEDADLAIEKYREYFSKKGIYENVLYDDVEKMLKILKENGKILIIATAKPTIYAIKILEYFDLLKYFDFVSGAELDESRSSKNEVIAYAIEKNDIKDLSTVIMIGDRGHDVKGAKEVGISSMGVLYGYGNEDEHIEAGADYIVKSIEEIVCFL